tara:strand:- start:1055 stop:2032 length:978 start_codon:yes stop_codon:yes gene_type:complete
MNDNKLNICQVSLARDIPIILINFKNFKKIYKKFKIFIICPKKELQSFKKKLNFKEFTFIAEEKILPYKKFNFLFNKLCKNIRYKKEFSARLNWYYQQILKISFIINFIEEKNESMIIWDADTIILKKINFFSNNYSNKYATLMEFHKPYFLTNKEIIGKLPNYFISSLVQFASLTVIECKFLIKLLKKKNRKSSKLSYWITSIVFKSIFKQHKIYNGSLFSEYELIGISNYLSKKCKQKAIFCLRSGLDGQLNKYQFLIAKLFNVYHVTYEHSHVNKNSQGMLERKQSWVNFLKIITKDYLKYSLRNLKNNFYYYLNIRNHKVD